MHDYYSCKEQFRTTLKHSKTLIYVDHFRKEGVVVLKGAGVWIGLTGSSGVSKTVGTVETPGPRECARDGKPWALRTQ